MFSLCAVRLRPEGCVQVVDICLQALEHLAHAERAFSSQKSSGNPTRSSTSSQEREVSTFQPGLAAAVLTRFARRGQALTVAQSIWRYLGPPRGS